MMGDLQAIGKRVSVAVRKSVLRRSVYAMAAEYAGWDDVVIVLKRFTWLPGAPALDELCGEALEFEYR